MKFGLGLGLQKTGKREYYLEFDGVDDYILIGNKLNFNFDVKKSIAFKFKLIEDGISTVLSKSDGNPNYKGWQVYFSDGKLTFRYYEDYHSGNVIGIKAYTNQAFNDGQWHKAVILYNGGLTPSVDIYIDDMSNAQTVAVTGSHFTGADTTNSAELCIARTSYGSLYFEGSLDTPSISDGLLNESQRNNIFIRRSGLAYWDFNEGHGIIAHDRTGNRNDGTLIGGATLPIWRKW